jgi:hypothetical protein
MSTPKKATSYPTLNALKEAHGWAKPIAGMTIDAAWMPFAELPPNVADVIKVPVFELAVRRTLEAHNFDVGPFAFACPDEGASALAFLASNIESSDKRAEEMVKRIMSRAIASVRGRLPSLSSERSESIALFSRMESIESQITKLTQSKQASPEPHHDQDDTARRLARIEHFIESMSTERGTRSDPIIVSATTSPKRSNKKLLDEGWWEPSLERERTLRALSNVDVRASFIAQLPTAHGRLTELQLAEAHVLCNVMAALEQGKTALATTLARERLSEIQVYCKESAETARRRELEAIAARSIDSYTDPLGCINLEALPLPAYRHAKLSAIAALDARQTGKTKLALPSADGFPRPAGF